MNPFKLHRASTLEQAGDTFKRADEARYLAGGQTLIPVLKQRLATPSDVVSLAGIAGLRSIKAGPSAVTIGAMTPHAEVAASPEVRRLIPALAELARGIGDPHVRNRGTLGGSVANNDPAADYPAAVLGLAAVVRTTKREIAADDFFRGLFTTALDEGEIITAIDFPMPERAGYVKFPNPASRYCLVGVMVAKGPAGVRVAVTGAGQDGVFRAEALETALTTSFAAETLADIAIPHHGLMTDIHAGAAYRAHLIGVLARRAVAKAIG
ncbi:MAG: xanthine dehydrogenase family protein subunit M [Hyphomicrobiaceae bacterium]|nr:xanthine dehydrogenase family protein subunit M [Hyphomicrobiaceae bacterium]